MQSPDLVSEIRAAKPSAPPALRERVREAAARQPEPRRPFLAALRLRRFLLVAAPVTAAAALGSAGVIGLVRSDKRQPQPGVTFAAQPAQDSATSVEALAPQRGAPTGSVTVPTDPGRAQRFEGSLTIRVEDAGAVSDATKRAMRLAQQLGGYVVAASVSTSDERGDATVTIRVPIARVQTALLRLSELGTIVQQQVALEDLQQQLDELNRRIAELRGEIADVERQLREGGLSDRERAELQARLQALREELAALTGSKRQTRQEAAYATLSVVLTTEDVTGLPQEPSRLDRAFDEALDILAWEALAALYVLVALAPLALVGGTAWAVLRSRRRREEAQLLQRS